MHLPKSDSAGRNLRESRLSDRDVNAAAFRVARAAASGAFALDAEERAKPYPPLGDVMFNRDALFGRKDEPTGDPRAVNVSPNLNAAPAMRPQTDAPKADLRFAEPARAPARAEEPVGSKL